MSYTLRSSPQPAGHSIRGSRKHVHTIGLELLIFPLFRGSEILQQKTGQPLLLPLFIDVLSKSDQRAYCARSSLLRTSFRNQVLEKLPDAVGVRPSPTASTSFFQKN